MKIIAATGSPGRFCGSLLLLIVLSTPAEAQWVAQYFQSGGRVRAVAQTSDGGYIKAGGRSRGGAYRRCVRKLDRSGNVEWQRVYAPSGDLFEFFMANDIQQTDDDGDGQADDGYIIAGPATYFDGARVLVWLLKLDPAGNVTWDMSYHSGFLDNAFSIQQTNDGGYVVAGYRGFTGNSESDLWVLKLDSAGGVEWQKSYDAGGFEEARSIQQTSSGGYIVAGWAAASATPDERDFWVLSLDSTGSPLWQKTYGGIGNDEARAVRQTNDGGYAVAGLTDSFGAGGNDVWVLQLDSAGNVEWQRSYGGSLKDEANALRTTTDGGLVVAGTTEIFGADLGDFWLLKLQANGDIQWQNAYDIGAVEVAYSIQQTTDGGYVVAGDAYWPITTWFDGMVVKLRPDGTITQSCEVNLSTDISPSATAATVLTTGATGDSTSFNPPAPNPVSFLVSNAVPSFLCHAEDCGNGLDDDGDGLTDCDDPECCDTLSCHGIGPCTTLTETVSGQDATVSNIAVVGNLGATIEFTSFELVTITTGPFAGKGFSRGIVELTHEGTPYSGTWRGMAYLDSPARKIHLKGAVTGGVTATVDGVLTESVADTGVYDRYQATWSIGRLSATSIAEMVDVTGDISYTNTTDYPSTVLYYLQESIETADSGHYGDSMNTVTTHLRVVTQANPYAGEGFSTISYTADSGLGQIWTHDTIVAQGLVQQTGLSDGALFGVVTSILDQTVVPTGLGISIERVDGALPPMADLQVKVWGPRAVSPGELINIIVEYRNNGVVAADDTVIACTLPSWGQIYSPEHVTQPMVGTPVGKRIGAGEDGSDFGAGAVEGIWRADTHEAVWKLGSVAPGEWGLLRVAVYFPWGIEAHTLQKAVAVYATSSPEKDFYLDPSLGPLFDLQEYLAHEPRQLGQNDLLTQQELEAELAADPELDALYQHAVGLGYSEPMYPGKKNITGGPTITQVTMLDLTAEDVLFLTRVDDMSVLGRYTARGLSIYDLTGGLSFDSFDGSLQTWGSWASSGSGSNKTAGRTDCYCWGNCITTLRNWRKSMTDKGVLWKMCAGCVFDHAMTGDQTICQPCMVPVSDSFAWNELVNRCVETCRQNPAAFCCSPGELKVFCKDNRIYSRFCLTHETWGDPFLVEDCNLYTIPSGQPCPKYSLVGSCQELVDNEAECVADFIASSGADIEICLAHDPNIKYGPERTVEPGEQLDYQVEFENMGEGTAYGVYFTDMLDGDLDESTMSIGPVKDVASGAVIAPPGTYDPASRTVSWFVGAVVGHAGGYADLSVGVRPDTPRGSEIINFGTVYFPSVPEETRTNAILSMIPVEICDDGIDNDGDGLTDCLDPECSGAVCVEVCNDGQDNDGDGKIDCVDPDCPPCPEDCVEFWWCVFRDGFETGDTSVWEAGAL